MAKENALVNNGFYDELGELWQSGTSHPVALLRAENQVRNPWILETVQRTMGNACHFLDIGCGGGLLTNFLSAHGMASVEGVDLSSGSLEQAKQADTSGRVVYRQANALCLPHKNASFNAVSAMDILEHVEYPLELIREAARVLSPGGLFFFHTFNRNFFSWLVAIKGLEWCVKNTPQNLHVYRLFIRPAELRRYLEMCGLEIIEMRGLKPVLCQLPLWKMVLTGNVDPAFRFSFSRSLLTGYCGYARKI
jgi:2-polyprenyl-6-hydroxyphenyl methylase/3-demethylubiquinone-9 3-methyltransferase